MRGEGVWGEGGCEAAEWRGVGGGGEGLRDVEEWEYYFIALCIQILKFLICFYISISWNHFLAYYYIYHTCYTVCRTVQPLSTSHHTFGKICSQQCPGQ